MGYGAYEVRFTSDPGGSDGGGTAGPRGTRCSGVRVWAQPLDVHCERRCRDLAPGRAQEGAGVLVRTVDPPPLRLHAQARAQRSSRARRGRRPQPPLPSGARATMRPPAISKPERPEPRLRVHPRTEGMAPSEVLLAQVATGAARTTRPERQPDRESRSFHGREEVNSGPLMPSRAGSVGMDSVPGRRTGAVAVTPCRRPGVAARPWRRAPPGRRPYRG
jgi:hypothetical protein